MKQIKKLLLSLLILTPGLLCAESKTDSLKKVIQKLDTALRTYSVDSVKTTLSPLFSISIASLPSAERYLDPLMRAKSITGVDFESIQQLDSAAISYVNAVFHTTKGATENSIIAIDKAQKILFIDYFDRLFGQSRYRESKQIATIPFIFENGSIILSLKVNKHARTLKFLFDTGADGMAIRKSIADSLNLTTNREQNASVVGGNVQLAISAGNQITLSDSFALQNQNIALIEQLGSREYDGIIGLNLATNHIVNVNFDTNQITLYTFGKPLNPIDGEKLSLTTPRNVIIVPGSLDLLGKKEIEGQFVFDTGANYQLIAFAPFVRKNRLLLSGFKPTEQATTSSMGVVTPVFKGKAKSFTLSPKTVFSNLDITLQASNGQADQTINRPDGSIGTGIINQFNFTIDLLQKELYLQARNLMR